MGSILFKAGSSFFHYYIAQQSTSLINSLPRHTKALEIINLMDETTSLPESRKISCMDFVFQNFHQSGASLLKAPILIAFYHTCTFICICFQRLFMTPLCSHLRSSTFKNVSFFLLIPSHFQLAFC